MRPFFSTNIIYGLLSIVCTLGRLISLIVADSGVHLARPRLVPSSLPFFLSRKSSPPLSSPLYFSLSLFPLLFLFSPKKRTKSGLANGPPLSDADVVLERRANTLNLPTYCRPRIIRFAARHRFTRATFHHPSIHPSIRLSARIEAIRGRGEAKGRLIAADII